MWRCLLFAAACGASNLASVAPASKSPPAAADEVERSPCAEVDATTPRPIAPTEADVLACAEFERSESTTAAPTRSRRVMREVSAGRLAQREERFLEAVAKFEAAHRLAPDDGGVLGELGWARFAASRWCEDNLEPDAQSPLAARCEPMTRDAAIDEMGEALDAPTNDTQRGALHYNLGRAFEWDMPEQAPAAYRASLCFRPSDTVRIALGRSLARRARRETGEDALRSFQAAVILDPDARRELEAAEARWSSEWRLASVEGPAGEVHANVEELCAQTRQPGDCRQVGEWVGNESWALGHLVMADRDDEFSMARSHVVAARTERGVSVVGELGTQSADRRSNAYVGEMQIEPEHSERSIPFASVRWVRGTASAAGCGWEAEASAQLLLCAREGERVRCFAEATLGPTEFASPEMLPTVQESLGNCEDDPGEIVSNETSALFDVDFDDDEIIIRREHDGRTWCRPLAETLCALSSAPRSCRH